MPCIQRMLAQRQYGGYPLNRIGQKIGGRGSVATREPADFMTGALCHNGIVQASP